MSGHDHHRQRDWIVRLRPAHGRSVDDLLHAALHLDVWAREDDALVAVVSEESLKEMEREGLVLAERICTAEEYKHRGGGNE